MRLASCFWVLKPIAILSSAKERILKRLRAASLSETPTMTLPEGLPPVYTPIQEELDLLFAQQFIENGGHFAYCAHVQELGAYLLKLAQERHWDGIYCAESVLQEALSPYALPLIDNTNDLLNVAASITTCEALVARTGTVCLSSQTASGRQWSIVPPVHIVVATTNQLVHELRDILSLQTARVSALPSMLCFASTNSRTADIEKTLVNGAHGPKELFVFLLDS